MFILYIMSSDKRKIKTNSELEPYEKKLKTSHELELPENYAEIRKIIKANNKLQNANYKHYKSISDNQNEIFKNDLILKKICPHKWERDWNDRSHKTSHYCKWCGI